MKKLMLICAIIVSCTTDSICPVQQEVKGTSWKLKRIMKLSKPICSYDSSFYYTYEFTDTRVDVTQFRNGVDSFVGSNAFRCNSLWFISTDSIYYGDIANYGVLVKKL